MPSPRHSLRGMLLAIAAVALILYAAREAATPFQPRSWVHAAIRVRDRPIDRLVGSGEPRGLWEPHVREVLDDDFLRSALPEFDPAWVRRRVVAGVAMPDQLWLHIETDSPAEREMLGRIQREYVRTHDARVIYPPNVLVPLTYPRAASVASAAVGTVTLVGLVALGRLLTRRWRGRGRIVRAIPG